MATEGEPTDLVKVFHLLVLSFTWGMQVWVSFIAGRRAASQEPRLLDVQGSLWFFLFVPAGFVLVTQVTRHTFGLVQSKLFPVYFYCLLGCNFVSLAVYAVYHPRELLDWHESVQVNHHIRCFVFWGNAITSLKLTSTSASSFPRFFFSLCHSSRQAWTPSGSAPQPLKWCSRWERWRRNTAWGTRWAWAARGRSMPSSESRTPSTERTRARLAATTGCPASATS